MDIGYIENKAIDFRREAREDFIEKVTLELRITLAEGMKHIILGKSVQYPENR
jgi:hypothetical protein